MTPSGIISGSSVSHTRASLDQLAAVSVESQQETVETLVRSDDVTEAFVLQTCNRVEIYVVTEVAERGSELVSEHFENVEPTAVREMSHEESLRHLLRVAAGLESLVLGEDQIIGQVRDAYEDARDAGGIGPILETGITKAIHVGERARTETAINDGVVSLASAAVKLAEEKRDLTDSTVAVIGAGEMGTLAAKRLSDRVEELLLVNRTPDRADLIREAIDPTACRVTVVPLEELPVPIERADVVISATGSEEPLLPVEGLTEVGETFCVDITRPRDIPPAADDLSHLTVYDLDKLEAVTEKTRHRRKQAAEEVEAIVDEEFDRLLTQYKRKRADRVISAMYESAERVKAVELEETLGTLDLDDKDEEIVQSMADAIVSQLLAAPTDSLRDAAEEDDWTTIHTALQLFDPRFGPASDDISPEFLTSLGESVPKPTDEDVSPTENVDD